jgi:hypothetical protein
MDFLALKAIAERDMALINPTSPAKIERAGAIAGPHAGSRVIEFGAGMGEVLVIWS